MQTQKLQQPNNIQLQLLRQLTHHSLDTDYLRSARVSNVNTLSHLLQFKNSKYKFSQTVRQQGQVWIKKKGGDLNNFIDKVKNQKQLQIKRKQQKKSQSDCLFFIPNLSFQYQKTYIEKNFLFGVINTIQSIFNNQKGKGNLAKRILKRRYNNKINNQQETHNTNYQQNYLDKLPVINMHIRNPTKKIQYLQATSRVLNVGRILKGSNWAQQYKNSTRQTFWDILSTQLSHLQSHRGDSQFQSLAIMSLKMVQKQFDKILPISEDNISYYLINNYLGKMKYQASERLWGIIFVLYRAGRMEEIAKYKTDQELRQYLEKAQASINDGKPIKITERQQEDDLFYNQIIYALKAEPKCASPAICDPNNLDIVWIFLRNLAIFKQNFANFIRLRTQLYQSYIGPHINTIKIKNLLYLLAYAQVAQIGTNDMMDQDDYLHYLIAIYHSHAFNLLLKQKKRIIQRKLAQQLAHYIQQLLLQHKSEYIKYMVLIPQSRMIEQVSSIVTSSQLIQTLDWKYLSKMLDQEFYQRLVYVCLRNYASFHQQYVHVATKSRQLIGKNQLALQLILQMLKRSSLQNIKINTLQIQKGIELAKSIMRMDEDLQRKYGAVFNFFQQFRKLMKLITERNHSKIYDFLRQSRFILISDKIKTELKQTLDMLISARGFECYILYMKNMVKAYSIALKRLNMMSDLKQISNLTFYAVKDLLKHQPYSQFNNYQSVKQLINIIEQSKGQFV